MTVLLYYTPPPLHPYYGFNPTGAIFLVFKVAIEDRLDCELFLMESAQKADPIQISLVILIPYQNEEFSHC